MIKDGGKNNRVICDPTTSLERFTITFEGDNHTVVIGKQCNLAGGLLMQGSNHTFELEDNCFVRGSGFTCANSESAIKIGRGTTIYEDSYYSALEGRSINIGRGCLFSSKIAMRTADSHFIYDIQDQRINPAQDIVIGNHVWVGERVTILKGVTVGDGSMIGCCSVAVKNKYPCDALIVGNPARVKKNNIKWKA